MGFGCPSVHLKNITARLNAAVTDALADPMMLARLADLAQEIFPRARQTPEALGALQKAEIEKWWPIIKAENIKARWASCVSRTVLVTSRFVIWATAALGHKRPLVEPHASLTLTSQTFAMTVTSSHSRRCRRSQIAFGFWRKSRRSGSRLLIPETFRDWPLISVPFAHTFQARHARPCLRSTSRSAADAKAGRLMMHKIKTLAGRLRSRSRSIAPAYAGGHRRHRDANAAPAGNAAHAPRPAVADPVFVATDARQYNAREHDDDTSMQLLAAETDAFLAWLTTPPTTMAGVIPAYTSLAERAIRL
jgi:hypothetical protein